VFNETMVYELTSFFVQWNDGIWTN